MAKKKAGGKIRQHERVSGKSLGLKVSGGEKVKAGSILVRQRGTKIQAESGTILGRDHTIMAVKPGKVKFGKKLSKTTVSVV